MSHELLTTNSTIRQRKKAPLEESTDNSKFKKALKSIDLFDKIKDDVIDQKTKAGGFISIVTFCIILIIIISECDYYFFQKHQKYNYLVDTKSNEDDQHVLLTFDIIVRTPCSQIGAGVSDDAGADIHSLDDISEQPAWFDMDVDEEMRFAKVQDLQKSQLDKDQILITSEELEADILPPSVEPLDFDEKMDEKKRQTNALTANLGGNKKTGGDLMQFGLPGLSGKHMAGFGGLDAIFNQMMAMDQAMSKMMNPVLEAAKPVYNKAPLTADGKTSTQTPDSCRFFGTTTLHKVKGTLHIVEGKKIKLGGMMANMQIIGLHQKKASFEHRINQLRFSSVNHVKHEIDQFDGEERHVMDKMTYTNINKDYSLQALDGFISENHGGKYQYFLEVVPIELPTGTTMSKPIKYYQYSMTESSQPSEKIQQNNFFGSSHSHDGIVISYDFSPIMVQITDEYKQAGGIAIFLVRMCSIIGGVLSISTFLTRASWCF